PHSPHIPDWQPAAVCARRGDWKLIRIFHDGADGQHRYELYNLREDIGERRNLASGNPAVVAELDAAIERFLEETGALRPQPNPAYDPAAAETVGGWQTRVADAASIDFNGRLKSLQYRAFGEGTAMTTAEPILLPPGAYVAEIRMLALAQGAGRLACHAGDPAAGAVAVAEIPVRHDRAWRDYRVPLRLDRAATSLALSPCGGSGTVQIRHIRILSADGAAVREWSFEKAPPRPVQAKPQPVVGGWQAGPNGHAAARIQDGCLSLACSGGDPMIMSSTPLGQAPGTYVLTLRMRSAAGGAAQAFGRPETRGYQPGTGQAFAVRHDGEWHEYRVELPLDHPLHELRIDPCSAPGEVAIDWIRLDTAAGVRVREWAFDAAAGN
ncbi:MAG: hypothetical protein JXR77_17570, partial [Lentisphaeria bacterium]|nr:hypothetical protein [Lentisphaeria bacterium]